MAAMLTRKAAKGSIKNFLIATNEKNDDAAWSESEGEKSENEQSSDIVESEPTPSVILAEIRKLRLDVHKIIADMQKDFKGLGDSIENAHAEIIDLKVSNSQTVKRVTKIETDQDAMRARMYANEVKMNTLERHSREYNIRISGIKEVNTQTDLKEDCKAKVSDILNKLGVLDRSSFEEIRETIEVAHRTGKTVNQKPRQIIAKFYSREIRNEVIKDTKAAKNEASKRFIYEDLTKPDFELRKRALPLMKAAYEGGKKCRFKNGNLYIEGTKIDIPRIDIPKIDIQMASR